MNPAPSKGMPMKDLPLEGLEDVASFFQVLSEPTRLQILNLLREGERNVGDLAQLCGFTAANISRHMTLLMKHGLVARESRGLNVYYHIADQSIYDLCDVVCNSIACRWERDRQKFAPKVQ